MQPGELAEIAAYTDLFAAAPASLPVRAKRSGPAVAMRVPGAPLVELNRIVGLRSVGELEELEPFFEGDPVVVSLDPAAGLDDELRARGYREGYPWQKFERGLERFEAQTDLRIADAAPGDFGRVIATAFGAPPAFAPWLDALTGRPGWHVVASYDGQRPVGGGALFASGDAGWLGIGGTLPKARGRGSQGAILSARIDRARELGLSVLVTETGVPRNGVPSPSYRNILRAGFRETYVRPNYVRR